MFSAALISQILLFAYFLLISYVNLFPFNNLKHTHTDVYYMDRSLGSIFLVLAPFGFIFNIPILMTVGTALLGLYFLGAVLTWWVPYFSKPSVAWAQTYQQVYKPTLVFLPGKGSKTVPNAEHVILHVLNLAAFVLSLMYVISQWPLI